VVEEVSPSQGNSCSIENFRYTEAITRSVSGALISLANRIPSGCEKPPQYGAPNLKFIPNPTRGDPDIVKRDDILEVKKTPDGGWEFSIHPEGSLDSREDSITVSPPVVGEITSHPTGPDYNHPQNPLNVLSEAVRMSLPKTESNTPYIALPFIPEDENFWREWMLDRLAEMMKQGKERTGTEALCSLYIQGALLHTVGRMPSGNAWEIENAIVQGSLGQVVYRNPASERDLRTAFREYRKPISEVLQNQRAEFLLKAEEGEHPKLLGLHYYYTHAEGAIARDQAKKGKDAILPHSHIIITIPTKALTYEAEKENQTVQQRLAQDYKNVDWNDPHLGVVQVQITRSNGTQEAVASLSNSLKLSLKKGDSFQLIGTCITDYFNGKPRVRNLRLMMAERAGKSPLYAAVSVTDITPMRESARVESSTPQNTTILRMTASTDGQISVLNEQGEKTPINGSIGEMMFARAMERDMDGKNPQDRQNYFRLLELSAYYLRTDPRRVRDGMSFFPVFEGIRENGINTLYTSYKAERKNAGDTLLELPFGTSIKSVIREILRAKIPDISDDAFERFFTATEKDLLVPMMQIIAKENPFTPFGEWANGNEKKEWRQQFEWDQTLFLSPESSSAINGAISPAWEAFEQQYKGLSGIVEPHEKFPFSMNDVLNAANGDQIIANAIPLIHFVERGEDFDLSLAEARDPRLRKVKKVLAISAGVGIKSYGPFQTGWETALNSFAAIEQYANEHPEFAQLPQYRELASNYALWQADLNNEAKRNVVIASIINGLSGHEVISTSSLLMGTIAPMATITNMLKILRKNLFKANLENNEFALGVVAAILQTHKKSAETLCRNLGIEDPVNHPDLVLRMMLDYYGGTPIGVQEAWGLNDLLTIVEKLGIPPDQIATLSSQVRQKRVQISNPNKPFPEQLAVRETFALVMPAVLSFLQSLASTNPSHPHIFALSQAFPGKDLNVVFDFLQREIDDAMKNTNTLRIYRREKDQNGNIVPKYPTYLKFVQALRQSTRASLADIYTMPHFEYHSRYSRLAERHVTDSGNTSPFASLQSFPQNARTAIAKSNSPFPVADQNLHLAENYTSSGEFLRAIGLDPKISLQVSLLELCGGGKYNEEYNNPNLYQHLFNPSKTSQETLFFAIRDRLQSGARFFFEWRDGGKLKSIAGAFIELPVGSGALGVMVASRGKIPERLSVEQFLSDLHQNTGKSSYLRATIGFPSQS
jgi:hypothetical protein